MPRQPRIHLPGSLHHVMARGIHGQNIFYDKKDLNHFLDRLKERFIQTDHQCYAWALMKNHFHFLIKSGETPLSTLMRRLLTGHAVYFNRRHKRYGHLFQNRYKSVLCQEDLYFLQLVRYIHLNPLRAGSVKTVKSLNKYKYTGHAYLIGELNNEWQDIAYPLAWFGKQNKRSREKYLTYVFEGINEGRRDDLTGGGLLRTAGGWKGLKKLKDKKERIMGDQRMLGDSSFVEAALKQTHNEIIHQEDYSLNQLINDICHTYNLQADEVRSACKQRHLRKAKSMICYIAVRLLKIKGIEVAESLNISDSTVSKLVTRYEPDEEYKDFIKQMMNL